MATIDHGGGADTLDFDWPLQSGLPALQANATTFRIAVSLDVITWSGVGLIYSGGALVGGVLTGVTRASPASGGFASISGFSIAVADMLATPADQRYTRMSAGDDTIRGTLLGADNMAGNAGNDLLYGYGGADLLSGGDGADWLYGGAGSDTLRGDAGADVLIGDFGPMETLGAASADWLLGGDGADILLGGGDADTLHGEAGIDWLFGGDGADALFGGVDGDVLIGDIAGESGADSLYGEAGADILIGGAGDDRLFGGADGPAAPAEADWLFGGDGADALYGGAGADVLYGDLFAGETGADALYGGVGDDILIAGPDADIVDGGDGADWLYGQKGADIVTGGGGADYFWLQSAADAGDVIVDFQPANGDRLVLYPVHQAAGWAMTTQAAFAAGIYGLVAWNGDTLLTYDADAAGPGAAVTLATLKLLAPGALNVATDFI